MKEIKVGVVGVGYLGWFHAKLLKELEGYALQGAFDIDLRKCEEVCNKLDIKFFEEFEELLREVEAVVIASSTSSHFKVASQCLEAGKDIFLEKPLTSTVTEAEKLVDKAELENLVIQVGHVERFNPAFTTAKKYIDQLEHIRAQRLSGYNERGADVSVVLDLMIHDIDLVYSLANNSQVEDLNVFNRERISGSPDFSDARIILPDGVEAQLVASRMSARDRRNMTAHFKSGWAYIDFATPNLDIFLQNEPPVEEREKFQELDWGTPDKPVYHYSPELAEVNQIEEELKEFRLSLLDEMEPRVSGRDALAIVEIAKMIERE